MKILAFDNSTSTCVVALQNGDQVQYIAQTAPMQQARLILPAIDQLLGQLQLNLTQLDAIAYGCGPGSFTGLRIAASVAQGLGYGANIPLLPISSLALLAQSAFLNTGCTRLHVAVDARMEQLYFASYTVKNGVVALAGEEQLIAAADVKIPLGPADETVCAVGDGWKRYLEQYLHNNWQREFSLQPAGKALLQLAGQGWGEERMVGAAEAIPVYLR